ncbi:MAG: Gfo/Idh/MocA family oxidoreductase [Capsulimonadales bacterium]|nr:Gfo/Idh/MocA family oxidoreductase [Capsulimonadales bacterium]
MEPITGRKVRIGVIGCGQIAQQHFTTYKDIPDAEIVACADINPEAADKSAAKFDIPNVYYNAHDMLRRDDLDAIDVCLHNNLHISGTLAALESGRHVYCEKPMAGTYRDAVTMRDRAKELGLKLHIQLGQLYSAETRAAKELIDAGQLGEVYHARSTGHRRRGRPYVDGYGRPDFVQKERSGGGALYDMGVYHISQILYLLGNPTVERVSGTTYQKIPIDPKRLELSGANVEELGMGFVRCAGDLTIDIIEAWAIHLDKFEGSYVVGSEGGVRLSPFGFFRSFGDLNVNGGGDMETFSYLKRKLRSADGDTDEYSNSQRLWVAALQGKAELLPTAEIALTTMLISEGIYLSAQERREMTTEEIVARSVSKALPL